MLAISDSAIGVHAIIYNSILINISVLYISIALTVGLLMYSAEIARLFMESENLKKKLSLYKHVNIFSIKNIHIYILKYRHLHPTVIIRVVFFLKKLNRIHLLLVIFMFSS